MEMNSANKKIEISIRGLLGGHSGMDIDKGRGNANKWMARIIWTLSQKMEIQLISFDGGSLRNAIPREATAVVCILPEKINELHVQITELIAVFQNEYQSIEPSISIQIREIQSDSKAVSANDFKKIISVLCAVPNGVFRMSPDIEGLVEASSSLARVIISNGVFTTQSLQRSSVESTKTEIAMAVRCSFENAGCEVVQGGEYPGWKPDPNSAILKIMEKLYSEMFNEAPKVKACHAGLECGILGKHLPGVDMISFGPNIRAAHSPDEKVQISSVQKFWKFYLETLKQTPIK
jgi:dipeptidase D